MTTRGTRIVFGEEAEIFQKVFHTFHALMDDRSFDQIIIPTLAYQKTFVDKAGEEVLDQMYTFKDKSDRELCLIPEVTGVIQELWDEGFFKSKKKPVKLFYINRCYRYEKPQEGRYREFWQAGIEILGDGDYSEECKSLLKEFLDKLPIKYEFHPSVKRGLSYYTEDGFEATCELLGAQKQIAGGGKYKQGIGWAVGLDRIVLGIKKSE